MRRAVLSFLVLLGCAAQPRAGRAYKDAPVVVAVAAGTAGAAEVAAAVVVTAAVGTVVVGAEQFPDPPAGTPPVETAPNDPPDRCRQCLCFKRGVGKSPKGNYRHLEGGGFEDYTRRTCQQDCDDDGYTGFTCAGDKAVTWFKM